MWASEQVQEGVCLCEGELCHSNSPPPSYHFNPSQWELLQYLPPEKWIPGNNFKSILQGLFCTDITLSISNEKLPLILPTDMASHRRLIIWIWIFCLSRGGTWKRGNIFERPVREDIASQRCIFFNIVQTGWGVKPMFNSLLGLLTTYNWHKKVFRVDNI